MIKYSFTYFHNDNKMKNNFFFTKNLKKIKLFILDYSIMYHRLIFIGFLLIM